MPDNKASYKTQQFANLVDLEIFLNDPIKNSRGNRLEPIALSVAADGSGGYILLYTQRVGRGDKE